MISRLKRRDGKLQASGDFCTSQANGASHQPIHALLSIERLNENEMIVQHDLFDQQNVER